MGLQPMNPFPNGYQLIDNMELGKASRSTATAGAGGGGEAAAAGGENEKAAAAGDGAEGGNEQKATREGSDENGGKEAKPSIAKSIADAGLKTDQYAKQISAMKTKGAAPGRDWEDQETLLLLEAMELHKDDWNRVADHVSRKL